MDYARCFIVTIFVLIILFMALGSLAACMLSSKISQEEEEMGWKYGRENSRRRD